MGAIVLLRSGAAASPGGGNGEGGVESVFGRAGPQVHALAGDYRASQVLNDSTMNGLYVRDALDAIRMRLQALQGVQANAAPVAVSQPGYQVNVYGSAPGTQTVAARADHNHSVLVAAPVPLGTELAEGDSYALARANHVHTHGALPGGALHQLATETTPGFMSDAHVRKLNTLSGTEQGDGGDGIPVQPNASDVINDSSVVGANVRDVLDTLSGRIVPNAAPVAASQPGYQVNVYGSAPGTQTVAARADHNHSVLVAPPRALSYENLEGTSYALARADHVHDHGAQAGGNRHAVATATTPGFMSDQHVRDLQAALAAPDVELEPTLAPPDVGSSSARGQSTRAAHADHTHRGVTSYRNRVGAVVPAIDDYSASQVKNDSQVAGSQVSDALNAVQQLANTKAATSNVINAGSGLTGGGAIGSNPTLAVGVISDAQHGQRGAGTTTQPLHTVATRTAPGFMSATHVAAVEDMMAAGGPSGLQLATTGQPAPVGGASARGGATTAAPLDHVHVGVSSFRGKVGAVLPAAGDYDTELVHNVPASSGVAGTTLSQALAALASASSGKASALVAIQPGTGLTGGGTLEQTRTLAVDGASTSGGTASSGKVPLLGPQGKLDPSFVTIPANTSDTVANTVSTPTLGMTVTTALTWLRDSKLATTQTLATGAGLKGGGALSAGLTLSVDGATTGGAAASGKVPLLNAQGKLDSTLLPAAAAQTSDTVANVPASSGVTGTTVSAALAALQSGKAAASAVPATATAAPAAVLPAGSTANIGAVTTRFAREDHQHVMPAIASAAVADANVPGQTTVAGALAALQAGKLAGGATINAGSGLTGGGAINTNPTLAVGVINDTQHGERGGGALHQAASYAFDAAGTTFSSGFLGGAERFKLAFMEPPAPLGRETRSWVARAGSTAGFDVGYGMKDLPAVYLGAVASTGIDICDAPRMTVTVTPPVDASRASGGLQGPADFTLRYGAQNFRWATRLRIIDGLYSFAEDRMFFGLGAAASDQLYWPNAFGFLVRSDGIRAFTGGGSGASQATLPIANTAIAQIKYHLLDFMVVTQGGTINQGGTNLFFYLRITPPSATKVEDSGWKRVLSIVDATNVLPTYATMLRPYHYMRGISAGVAQSIELYSAMTQRVSG